MRHGCEHVEWRESGPKIGQDSTIASAAGLKARAQRLLTRVKVDPLAKAGSANNAVGSKRFLQ
jgi:hypothetical protein